MARMFQYQCLNQVHKVSTIYNAACIAGRTLAHFRMLIREFLNKDSDVVLEEDPLIIFYIKSAFCMDENGKDTKNTSNILRRVHFVSNG